MVTVKSSSHHNDGAQANSNKIWGTQAQKWLKKRSNFKRVLPLFALGYPLYASIRAIETNSNHQMKSLLTYWILLSSISLFELAFVKLTGWIPFWPFLKMIAISCLVLHRFTGAYYAYKWLVRLFLSVNQLQRVQVINWLNKRKELSLERETFLAVAERYLNENGTEDLKQLISRKSNSKDPNVAQNDINSVEHEENVAATDKIVKHIDTNLSQTQQKLDTSTAVKEVTSAATVRDYVITVPPALRIQKEWTCAVCLVKTTSEGNLNSHLQGRKHKSKCEELKSSKQAMKIKGSSSTASNQEPKEDVSGNRLGQNKNQNAEEKLQVDVKNKQWKPRKPVDAAVGIRESKCWYGMPNVACLGPVEIDRAARWNGRTHLPPLAEFDDILRVPNYGAMAPLAFKGVSNYGAMVGC